MGAMTFPPRSSRPELNNTGLGFTAETYPLLSNSGGQGMTAQNLRATSLGLRAGDVISNIVVCVTVAAGGTAGSAFVGLYDSSLNKVAASADVQASFGATGLVSLALSASYTVTADGLFYPVYLLATAYGSTQPSLAGQVFTGAGTALSGKARPNFVQASQASLPVSATAATSSLAIWFAVN